jgi:hypothetical protein
MYAEKKVIPASDMKAQIVRMQRDKEHRAMDFSVFQKQRGAVPTRVADEMYRLTGQQCVKCSRDSATMH